MFPFFPAGIPSASHPLPPPPPAASHLRHFEDSWVWAFASFPQPLPSTTTAPFLTSPPPYEREKRET